MKKILIGNWKMNMTGLFADGFLSSLSIVHGIDVRIAPSFTLLPMMRDHAERVGVKLGGQNMSEHKEGAYTGEVSASMLKDAGATFVLLGHSERRHLYGETSRMIERKVETAVVEGLPFVLCVGETEDERNRGKGDQVIIDQLTSALTALTDRNLHGSMIAYEPVWAIGTGNAATENLVEDQHGKIREALIELFGDEGQAVPILYGGSVTLDNLGSLLELENVDGTLVGGASLNPKTFNEMIKTTGEY